jgi:hypothetical protein
LTTQDLGVPFPHEIHSQSDPLAVRDAPARGLPVKLRDRICRYLGIVALADKLDNLEDAVYERTTSEQLAAFESHWNAHKIEIMEALARIESRSPVKRVTPISPSTWEDVQAAHAANPRNFEEIA